MYRRPRLASSVLPGSRILSTFGASALVLALLTWSPLAPRVDAAVPGASPALRAIEAAAAAEALSPSAAARQKLYLLFEPSQLDPQFQFEESGPLRCATLVLEDLRQQADSFDEPTRALYDGYLGESSGDTFPTSATLVYETTNFYLEFSNVGPNAPPLTDVDPAHGVPDFVERAGESCEYSWSIAVGSLGYTAPPPTSGATYNNKYLIQFQNQGSYGYTQVISGQRTKIVLENDYVGFPPNDDPDGPILGAMRVTVAHELKHAIQRTYTNWTEGGWVELDATWMEDIVYDVVNDYYNYLSGAGSPFTNPELSLDNDGSTTTGSYEDCNWEHYQTEKHGNGHMLAFWNRRQANPVEPVLTTYAQNLITSGSSMVEAWGEYVAWNFTSGDRAGAGFGYGEAAEYPTSPPTGTYSTLPIPSTGGSVNRLAAHTHWIQNDLGLIGGTPTFTFNGNAATTWAVSVVYRDLLGGTTQVPMTLVAGAGTLDLIGVDYGDLEWAALVVGNANTAGGASAYTFTADTITPLYIAHQLLWDTENDSAPYDVLATVTAGTDTPDAGAIDLRYRVDGGGETVVAMTPTGNPDEYEAAIPAQSVGAFVEYRIEAEGVGNETAALPAIAGGFAGFTVVTVFEPFESAGGWTVGAAGDGATTGIWERVVPIGTAAQPGVDATLPPGSLCFVTENGTPGGALGEADVDGGRTTLTSPDFVLDEGPYSSITVRYRRWYSNALGAAFDDTWLVDVSDDAGASWTNLETLSVGSESWEWVSVDLQALLGNPDSVRFRFLADDAGAGSIVEAGVDDFEIIAVPMAPVAVGDAALAFRLGAPAPNPRVAGGAVAMTLELPGRSFVRAAVVDAAGRRVRSLQPGGIFEPGAHRLEWDGRGEGGVRLAAGVYFLSVETRFGRADRKVVLIR